MCVIVSSFSESLEGAKDQSAGKEALNPYRRTEIKPQNINNS